jgi:hypothetical protein
MSKSDRIPAIAAGLTLIVTFAIGGYILGFGLGQQSGEREANSDTYARHAQDEINSACAGLDGTAQTECIVRVVEATNEHKRSESDLNAQRNMAKWALLMLLATLAMAATTVFGVYYVWRTLLTTREIGEAQVRAYVYVTNVKISVTSNALKVEFTNLGNSPGKISFVDCKVLISDPYRPKGPKVVWSQAFWHDGFQLGPQGPKEVIFRLGRGRGKYLEGKIEEDGIGVFVQGKFQCIDVFGIKTVQGIDVILSDGVRA